MGAVMQGATVQVYLAGTTTLAIIYPDAVSAAITGSLVTSGQDGRFYFWVDTGDYALTQLFKVVGSLSGYQSQTVDNLVIYPMPGIASSFQPLATDPASPVASQTWFNTTDHQFKGYNGSAIVILG